MPFDRRRLGPVPSTDQVVPSADPCCTYSLLRLSDLYKRQLEEDAKNVWPSAIRVCDRFEERVDLILEHSRTDRRDVLKVGKYILDRYVAHYIVI